METISLKALSRKALERNLKGNSRETEAKKQGNFWGENEVKSFSEKMPLSEFQKAGLILPVWSEVLREKVYFISSEALRNRCRDAIAYTSQELQAMFSMAPEEVRAAHEIKRAFHKARLIIHNKEVSNV